MRQTVLLSLTNPLFSHFPPTLCPNSPLVTRQQTVVSQDSMCTKTCLSFHPLCHAFDSCVISNVTLVSYVLPIRCLCQAGFSISCWDRSPHKWCPEQRFMKVHSAVIDFHILASCGRSCIRLRGKDNKRQKMQ